MSAARGRLIAVFVGATFTLGAGVVLYRQPWATSTEMPLTGAVSTASAAPDDPPADWCAPGFEPIRGGGCFASSTTKAAPLIVYLHGRYARAAASDEVDRQRRLGARATALGFAVLALRGRLGACTSPDLASWYCWPSNETNADAGADFVNGWTSALADAQERAGSNRRFLLGFSNGGYFAGLVASRGLLEFEALVVAHGGPVEPVHPLHGAPPMLLLSADDDVAQDEMIRFDQDLSREHWAHDSYARAGGHGLTDLDIDTSLTFFARAHEALPLQPPLPLHRAVWHVRDAGSDGDVLADVPPDTGTGAPEPVAHASAADEDASGGGAPGDASDTE
jgi:predicted esterase